MSGSNTLSTTSKIAGWAAISLGMGITTYALMRL
jgi:hypothetical protein